MELFLRMLLLVAGRGRFGLSLHLHLSFHWSLSNEEWPRSLELLRTGFGVEEIVLWKPKAVVYLILCINNAVVLLQRNIQALLAYILVFYTELRPEEIPFWVVAPHDLSDLILWTHLCECSSLMRWSIFIGCFHLFLFLIKRVLPWSRAFPDDLSHTLLLEIFIFIRCCVRRSFVWACKCWGWLWRKLHIENLT